MELNVSLTALMDTEITSNPENVINVLSPTVKNALKMATV
jgi:hypothetical protein